MIFLYLLIVGCLGFTTLELLDNKHIIDIKEWTIIEYFVFSITFGWLLFTIYMFALAFFNIKYNFYILFVPLFLNSIFALYFFAKHVKEKKFTRLRNSMTGINKYIYIIFTLVFVFVVVSFMLNGYSHYANIVDEFSYWVLHPKAMFLTGYTNTLSPNYPHFLSYLYSGHYFFVNKIANNEIRIIQAILLLFCYLIAQVYASKHKLNKAILSVLFVLLSLYYTVFWDISTSTFADISFMYFYSFSCIYLVEWIFVKRTNNNLFLAIMFLSLTVWCKTDGLYLSVFSLFVLAFFKLFSNTFKIDRISHKACILYVTLGEFLIVLWKIYSKFYFVASSNGLGTKLNVMPGNFIPMLIAMKNQILSNNYIILLFMIFVYCLIYKIPKQKIYNKTMLYTLSSFVVINYLFLVVCYLLLFGVEGVFAASFVRYMVHIVPILFIIFDYCYTSNIRRNKNEKNL